MNNFELPNDIKQINDKLITSNIARYQRPARIKSVFQLCNTLIPLITLLAAGTITLNVSVWLTLPIIFVASGFMIRTFIIFHDCGHRSFFESPNSNRFWGLLTGILTFTPYYYWKMNHDRHHGTSGNLDKRGFGDVWTMTVTEYRNSSLTNRIKYRLYRNPFIMLLLGPLSIMLITHRLPLSGINKKERNSVYLTNISFLLILLSLSLIIGSINLILVYFFTLYIGLIGGIWLFYVQHQFEDVYWVRTGDWNFIEASLKGGSFYKLPKILNWITGNIGYHHVHHLLSGIPNYNLPRSHEKTPIIDLVEPVRLVKSLKSLKFRLWDEDRGKLVSFREIRNS